MQAKQVLHSAMSVKQHKGIKRWRKLTVNGVWNDDVQQWTEQFY